MFRRLAGIDQRSNNAARRRACCGDGRCGRKQSGGNHRPQPRNGQQAEARQQSGTAAESPAYAGAFRGIRHLVHISMGSADVLVGDQAYLA